MALAVVQSMRPDDCVLLANQLRELADQAERGEIETLFIVGVAPDGNWFSGQRGKSQSVMASIGALETLKIDLIESAKAER